MKKRLSMILALVMCLGAFTMAATAAQHLWLGGVRIITVNGTNSGIDFSIRAEHYIGETKGTLKLDLSTSEYNMLDDGQERTYCVFLLPDEESVHTEYLVIAGLADDGKERYLVDGGVYLSGRSDYKLMAVSPVFAWGVREKNSDGSWSVKPIGPGSDSVTLVEGDYPVRPLDDGKGHVLDAYRPTVGEAMAFSNPDAPKGIPYYIYWSFGTMEAYYEVSVNCLVLTPKIADEILETGGYNKDGVFYPILEYFPDVKDMILLELARRDTQSPPPVLPSPPQEAVAAPTSSTVKVNGQEVAFDAYIINENNYFKLRDLAYILNGTGKQFGVSWEAATDTVLLTSGAAYLPVGGEMQGKGAGDKMAQLTTSRIMLDGVEVELTVYLIEGNNYFKLRDVGAAIDFGVDWEAATNTVIIDTSKGYMP